MVGHKERVRKITERVENEERELASGVIIARRRGGGLLPRESEFNMQTDGVLLVAVERGASLPTWVGHCQDRVSDVFVLADNTDEPADTRLRRLEQRMSLLVGSDYRQGLVVLVAAPVCASPVAEEYRMQIAERLLSHLAVLDQGKLLLMTEETAPLESRVQLLSMAGTLAQRVRGTRISISVRFGARSDREPPPEIFGVAEATPRRSSRRPPHQSGSMPRQSVIPTLHKATSLPPKRRLSHAS